MVVNYFRFESAGADGGSIYDDKLISALRLLNVEVNEINVERIRRVTLPHWARSFTKSELKLLRSKMNLSAINLVSHEGLYRLVDFFPVELFIVHNVFSIFEYPDRKDIELLYHFCSEKPYEKICSSARKVLSLSAKESRFLGQYENSEVINEPPGIRYESGTSGFDVDMIKIAGTSDWFVKKSSQLKPNDIKCLQTGGFKVSNKDDCIKPSYSLIEERFVVGFKLKLIQMLYRGDIIASLAPLDEEVRSLNVPELVRNYKTVSSVEEALEFFSTTTPVPHNIVKDVMYQKYCWNSIATRILNKIKR